MKMPHRRSLLALVAALTLPAAACGKKEPAGQATQATQATPASKAPPATSTAGVDAGATQAEVGEAKLSAPDAAAEPPKVVAIPKVEGTLGNEALAHIPGDSLVVWAATPAKIWQGLGFDGLVGKYEQALADKFGPQWASMKAVLDGSQPVGLDASGVAGFAWPSATSQSFIGFAAVSDRAKFEETLAAFATKAEAKLVKEATAGGTTITVEGQNSIALFLTDKAVYVAFGDDVDAKALAGTIAATTPDKSPLASERYAAASAAAGQADAVLFVDVKRVMDLGLQAAAGGGPRGGAIVQLMELVSGAAGTLTVAANINEDAVEATGRLAVGEGSQLTKLMPATGKVVTAVSVSDALPLLLIGGKIDWKVYSQLVELFFQSQGEDLAGAKAKLATDSGLDFEKDILGALSGEVGFTVTGNIADVMGGKGEGALGGAAYIGINDPTAAKTLLKTVATRLLGMPEGKAGADVLTLPVKGRSIYLKVAGNYLVAATDKAIFARFEKPADASKLVDAVANAKLKTLVARTDLGALLLVDQALAATIFMAGSKMSDFPMSGRPDKLSKEEAAKWTELEKARKAVAELEDKAEAERNTKMFETVAKLGTSAEAVWTEGSNLVWHLGQYPKGATVKETVAAMVDLAATSRARVPDPKAEELRAKIDALQNELMAPRMEEKAIAPPTPAPK